MSTKCLRNGTFIIEFLPSFISLPIILSIFLVSIKQLKSKQHIQSFIKTMYFIICILSIISTTINLVAASLCIDNTPTSRILFTLYWALYFCGLACVLAILLLRLYFTFKGSIFEISSFQKWIFVVLYIVGMSSIVLIVVTYFFGYHLKYSFIFMLFVAFGGMIYLALRYYFETGS